MTLLRGLDCKLLVWKQDYLTLFQRQMKMFSSSFDEMSSMRPQDGRIEHLELHNEVSESYVSMDGRTQKQKDRNKLHNIKKYDIH